MCASCAVVYSAQFNRFVVAGVYMTMVGGSVVTIRGEGTLLNVTSITISVCLKVLVIAIDRCIRRLRVRLAAVVYDF